MTMIMRDLSRHMRAKWDSENAVLSIEHVPSDTKLNLSPNEQIELIRLLEVVVEEQLPIGKKT